MRIAVSGAHRTGKTTLVEALARALPAHLAIDEPYYLLEEEGHQFSEQPALEDFAQQLERSIELVAGGLPNRIFDRCPADFLAYLLAHEDAASFDIDTELDNVGEAMACLDLIVFAAIERPDPIAIPASERGWRRRVDAELRDILLTDRWDWGVATVEVAGPVEERVRQVIEAINGAQ